MILFVLLSALSTLLSSLETNILQSDFSLSIQEQGQAPLTTPGKVTMQGELFIGQSRGYEVAYDGATFYLYDPDADELMLSKPRKETLMESNPLLFVKYMQEVCTIRETTSKDGTITVTMVPQGVPMETAHVILKIKKEMPSFVEIKESKRTTTLRLKNPHYISTAPAFKISKPGVYINDLR